MTDLAIIVGVSSGLGEALTSHLAKKRLRIAGTFRSHEHIGAVEQLLTSKTHLDLSLGTLSVDNVISRNAANFEGWRYLVLLPATMLPLGKFMGVDSHKWESAFDLNFLKIASVIKSLIPLKGAGPASVITLAGGGVNSAPAGTSAYTVSKIALIKLMEILNEEILDVSFTSVGPGWVKTRIHNEIFQALPKSDPAHLETTRRLQENDFNDPVQFCEFVWWVFNQSKEVVGGRNFSSQHDLSKVQEMQDKLSNSNFYNFFKLRRFGNDLI